MTGDHPATTAAIAARGRARGRADRHRAPSSTAWDDDRLDAELPTLHVVARAAPRAEAAARRRRPADRPDGRGDRRRRERRARPPARRRRRGDGQRHRGRQGRVGPRPRRRLVRDPAVRDPATAGGSSTTSRRASSSSSRPTSRCSGSSSSRRSSATRQPLLPIQILWLELFIDVSTSVAFEREPAEPDVMRRPPRNRGRAAADDAAARPDLARGRVQRGRARWPSWPGTPGTCEHARWVAFTALVVGQAVRAYANRSLTPAVRRPCRGTRSSPRPACSRIAIQALIPVIPGRVRGVPGDAARPLRLGARGHRRARAGGRRRDRPVTGPRHRVGRLRNQPRPFVSWSWNSIVPWSAIERTMNEFGWLMP